MKISSSILTAQNPLSRVFEAILDIYLESFDVARLSLAGHVHGPPIQARVTTRQAQFYPFETSFCNFNLERKYRRTLNIDRIILLCNHGFTS